MNKIRILLAINPFDENLDVDYSFLKFLLKRKNSCGVSVKPLFVAGYPILGRETEVPAYEQEIQEALDNLIAREKIPATLEPKLLFNQKSAGTRGVVRTLLDHADDWGATHIAVVSHGRRGIERMALGSFAEELLEEATIPILFLPRSTNKSSKSYFNCLFPHDLSKTSDQAVIDFLDTFASLNPQLKLMHCAFSPETAVLSEGVYVPKDFFVAQVNEAKSTLTKLANDPRLQGTKVQIDVLDDGPGYLDASTLFKYAKKSEAMLLVLPTTSTPIGRLFFSSVSWEVFRERLYPCLVYGPKFWELANSSKKLNIRNRLDAKKNPTQFGKLNNKKKKGLNRRVKKGQRRSDSISSVK